MTKYLVIVTLIFSSYIGLCLTIRFTCGRVLLGRPVYEGIRQVEIPFGKAGLVLVFPYAYLDYKITGTMWAYYSDGSGKIVGG